MFDLTSNTTLMTSFACAALNPGLRSILMLDAPPAGLQSLANILAGLLRAATDQTVRQYQLPPFESDDAVWGSLYLPWHTAESEAHPVHRLFSAERNAQELQLLVVPDLAALSLTAARSVTMLLGADVVHLERNGLSACWHPRQCWLVGCRGDDIGKISPHLLERFALRLSWEKIAPGGGENDTLAVAHLLELVPEMSSQETVTIPAAYLQQIARAAQRHVELSRTELAHVLEYVPTENHAPRREIALARFAQALAQLSDASSSQDGYVDSAARMLGFTRKREYAEPIKQPEEVAVEDDVPEEPVALTNTATISATSLLQEMTQPVTAQQPADTFTSIIESGTLCSNPYPEDDTAIEREQFALKFPPTGYGSAHAMRGAIVGVEESDSLYDLALVHTLLAAMKFQPWRQRAYYERHKKKYPGLLLEPADLRRYRRSLPVEQVFMLLFDYTSIGDDDNWEDALVQYLHAAYTGRAGIVIIKVGANDALSPLRAEVVSEKNVLVPRVGRALEAGRGSATPLAHGFSLALEQLQRVLQHGRNTAQRVTFVVVSDGRGNVPLATSTYGEQIPIVTREGIDDAWREARKIRALKHIVSIVLSPQPDYYPDLPVRLAEMLGATLLSIPQREAIQEGQPL